MPLYWVKVIGQSRPTKVLCGEDADIDTFTRAIKREFAQTFAYVDVHQIVVKSPDGVALEPDVIIGTLNVGLSKNDAFLVPPPEGNILSQGM